MSDRAKIRNRRVTGNDVQQQREVAAAIKLAREMALLPYAKRVSTQRTRPPRDGRRERDGEGRPDAEQLDERTDGTRGANERTDENVESEA
jgi:small subunit ribosomal protein S18